MPSQRHTQRSQCENGGTYYSVGATSQGLSVQFSRSVVSDSLRPRGQQHARPPCHQLLKPGGEAWNSPSESPEGVNPANPLISNFWSPELREKKFLLFYVKFVAICYGSPKK